MTLTNAAVLVVDDEPILTMTFGVLLQREGATVHIAGNGKIALEVLGRESIDVMLCDQQMPVMDGMALLRTMHDRAILLPIVLFVNDVEGGNAEELKHLGVLATLTKPVRPEVLIRILNEVLVHRSPSVAPALHTSLQGTPTSPAEPQFPGRREPV